MIVTQNEKALRFRGLHEGPGAFVIPNSLGYRLRPHSCRLGLPGIGHLERSLRLFAWAERW
jgi:hypothetical protein